MIHRSQLALATVLSLLLTSQIQAEPWWKMPNVLSNPLAKYETGKCCTAPIRNALALRPGDKPDMLGGLGDRTKKFFLSSRRVLTPKKRNWNFCNTFSSKSKPRSAPANAGNRHGILSWFRLAEPKTKRPDTLTEWLAQPRPKF